MSGRPGPTPRALADKIEARIRGLKVRNTPNLRRLRREYTHALRHFDPDLVLELALELVRRSGSARRMMAYELVAHHSPTFQRLRLAQVVRLGEGIDTWDAVDMFALYVAGPAWRGRQISDAAVRRWAASEDRWWRRTALVCTVALNNKARGGEGDTAQTLDVCARLVDDRDDMVVKALSWALRELVKRDPEAVRGFLESHGGRVAARAVREVNNKLDTGLKNPRRRRRST